MLPALSSPMKPTVPIPVTTTMRVPTTGLTTTPQTTAAIPAISARRTSVRLNGKLGSTQRTRVRDGCVHIWRAPCDLLPLYRHSRAQQHLITVLHLRRQRQPPTGMLAHRLPLQSPMEIRGFHRPALPDRLMLKGPLRLARHRIEMRGRRLVSATVMTAHLHRGMSLTEMLDRRQKPKLHTVKPKRELHTVKPKRELRPMMRDYPRVMKLLIS